MYNYISLVSMINDIRTIIDLAETANSNTRTAPILFSGLLPYLSSVTDSSILLIGANKLELEKNWHTSENWETLQLLRDESGQTAEKSRRFLYDNNEKRYRSQSLAKVLKYRVGKRFMLLEEFNTYSYNDYFIGSTFFYNWFFDDAFKRRGRKSLKIFSKAVGQFASGMEAALVNIPRFEARDTELEIPDVSFKTFNLRKKNTNLIKNDIDRYVGVYLFNLLSSLNFVLFFMSDILRYNNSFCIRMKYMIHSFVATSLEWLIQFAGANPEVTTCVELYRGDIKKMSGIKNIVFDHCLRHYAIDEEALPKKWVNLHEPFGGLIQSVYGMETKEFVDLLDHYLLFQSEILSHWILKTEMLGKVTLAYNLYV